LQTENITPEFDKLGHSRDGDRVPHLNVKLGVDLSARSSMHSNSFGLEGLTAREAEFAKGVRTGLLHGCHTQSHLE